MQASVASAISFSLGAGIPLLAAAFIHDHTLRLYSIFASSTVALLLFGAIGAALGGASLWKGSARVAIGGCACGFCCSATSAASRAFFTAWMRAGPHDQPLSRRRWLALGVTWGAGRLLGGEGGA